MVGWYSVGQEPDADDIALHAQVSYIRNDVLPARRDLRGVS